MTQRNIDCELPFTDQSLLGAVGFYWTWTRISASIGHAWRAEILSTYFSEEIESWCDIDYAPQIRTVSSVHFHLHPARIMGNNWHFTRRTLKMKLSRIDSWKRWICFHLVTLQSWCYQAFSESHRHLLNLAFIIATKCQCEIEWKERNVVMQSLLLSSHPHD